MEIEGNVPTTELSQVGMDPSLIPLKERMVARRQKLRSDVNNITELIDLLEENPKMERTISLISKIVGIY